MGIPILVRRHLCIETVPWALCDWTYALTWQQWSRYSLLLYLIYICIYMYMADCFSTVTFKHTYVWSFHMLLPWRHNERDGVSNHRRLHCLLNCWFRRRSKNTWKLRVTGLCAVNSPVTDAFRSVFPFDDVIMQYTFPSMAASVENVRVIWKIHIHCIAQQYLTLDTRQYSYYVPWRRWISFDETRGEGINLAAISWTTPYRV